MLSPIEVLSNGHIREGIGMQKTLFITGLLGVIQGAYIHFWFCSLPSWPWTCMRCWCQVKVLKAAGPPGNGCKATLPYHGAAYLHSPERETRTDFWGFGNVLLLVGRNDITWLCSPGENLSHCTLSFVFLSVRMLYFDFVKNSHEFMKYYSMCTSIGFSLYQKHNAF